MSIELKQVSYTYMPKTPYEHKALDAVSFTLEEGSFTAIAGHTGSGKSTLVQHLNGLLHPENGQVLVDGTDLAASSKQGRKEAMAARNKVGMVFQYPEQQLFEETIAADIAFGPKNQGIEGKELEERIKESMELMGLAYDEFKDRSPFQLSGGQKRRVAIAGVLALHPKYLVLDEPTAGLDPLGREALIQTICKLHKKWKLTIVFVSHNMEDIARLADSVIIMNHGKMAIKAAPQEAFMQTELLQAAGLQEPAMLHLLHRLREAGIPVNDNAIELETGIKAIREALSDAE
ncbi:MULTISPECIES: energy-coupling factor transporter ATPase [Selenomonas]|uniref:Energy-coupling factor transporter ATP-binding protein EcfA2 n=1 Tax=Selenomonas ruminis TaxID=2593411 RepID=A0A5D6W521_9FIRM|nr:MULTISPECIES: energy-coupling factor transporter ATPase [unclassified Selenomonas]MBQ1867299.1 energy-coupling factor transporter ATPase [Selenomonas sp.]TYZ23017.1 energy-coupling factor transporter ATPase [Selenomonas sp. mPRGC5]